MNKTILIELNEINFIVLEKYIQGGLDLVNFKRLMQNGYLETSSEKVYEHLEPWIQWVSVHTGLNYAQHKIFRLGDIVNSTDEQIFEKLEKADVSVGAISPMNTRNCLQAPHFFIPDPWTYTSTDGKWHSKFLDAALKQAVNDNSQGKITKGTYLRLSLALIGLLTIQQLISLPKLFKSIKGVSYRKAIFLDKILSFIFLNHLKKKNTDFASIFLNAGAHIQHHYFHNSKHVKIENCQNPDWYVDKEADPLAEVLLEYDKILGSLLSLENYTVVIATGLSQNPTKELVFYYRLRQHEKFLREIGLTDFKVKPRMTRDFLIEFNSEASMKSAKLKLQSCKISGVPVFAEIDERDLSLFVTFTYDKEVCEDDTLVFDGGYSEIYKKIVFVALKNGEHCEKGYVASSSQAFLTRVKPNSHVSNLNESLCEYILL